MCHLAEKIAASMLFAVLRAANLCMRSSIVKWRRRMKIEDGTGLTYLP